MSIRAVKSISQSVPTLEGAGVRLRRAFGFGKTSDFDPFLLLDDFRNEHPEDYLPGFPWHPHRGIETITYVLSGSVTHGDSLGNKGTMGAGDVQWMTAGSGILHQEMPKGDERGRMHGFQLWANLPRTLKMTDPRYQDIHAQEIPEVVDDDGTRVRVVAGDFWGKKGPVEGRFPWSHRGTPSRTCSKAAATSVTPRRRRASAPTASRRAGGTPEAKARRKRATARWSCSIQATRSRCRRVSRACASCWFPASRCRNRWRGRDQL